MQGSMNPKRFIFFPKKLIPYSIPFFRIKRGLAALGSMGRQQTYGFMANPRARVSQIP